MPLGKQLAVAQDILHHASRRLHGCLAQTAMARAATPASAKLAGQPSPQACVARHSAWPAYQCAAARAGNRAPNSGAVREVDAAAAAGRAGHERPQRREARRERGKVGLALRIAAARVDARVVGAAAAAARGAAFPTGGTRPAAGARGLGVRPAAGHRGRRPRALAARGAVRGGAVAAFTRLGSAARPRLGSGAWGRAAGGDSAVGALASRASAAPGPRARAVGGARHGAARERLLRQRHAIFQLHLELQQLRAKQPERQESSLSWPSLGLAFTPAQAQFGMRAHLGVLRRAAQGVDHRAQALPVVCQRKFQLGRLPLESSVRSVTQR